MCHDPGVAQHEHTHGGGGHGQGHDHAAADRELLTHRAAIRAVWVSAVGLGATALFQLGVVAVSNSTGLLADALHNVGDVLGTATLWVAFTLARRPASPTFPYGWRRAEDLGGIVILLAIVASAALAGVESFRALLGESHRVENLPIALVAAGVGVLGNEAVAQYKIRVGRRIDSAALVADGQHARTDGLASAGAAVGLVGVGLGFPAADPLAGIAITLAILWIAVDVGRDVLRRAMDAVPPGLVDRIRALASDVPGVEDVHGVRARQAGRSLLVQLHADVAGTLPLAQAHEIGEQVRHAIVHALPEVVDADVHLDPTGDDDAHAATAHHFRRAEQEDG